MLDLDGLRVFAKVAELRSMSAAARALRRPRSSVSREIARLEAALGVRLLQRTTRRVGLTDVGSTFHRHCLRILGDVDEAEAAVGALQASPRGHLRVSAPITFGQALLGPLIAEFLALHPDVTVALDLDSRRVDVVGEEVDVALRIGRLADSSLIARRLAAVPLRLCASPSYAAAHGLPAGPGDLARHATLAAASGARAWSLVHASGAARDAAIAPRLVVGDPTVLREAALRGAGIAALPFFLCDPDLAAGRLVPVPLSGWHLPPPEVHALYPSHRSLSPKVRVFVDHLAARLGSALPPSRGQDDHGRGDSGPASSAARQPSGGDGASGGPSGLGHPIRAP